MNEGAHPVLNLLTNKRVLILAGEASGDQHAAKLVNETLKLYPDIEFFGMGGEKMRQAGVDILVDNKAMAVVGAVEVLRHIKPIWLAWRKLRQVIQRHVPDLVVLVDYPGFNLQIARIAKQAGIKVLYYISPQIWAWQQHRIHVIRQRVDKMLVIFPFEESLYQRAGVPVEYVGHPLSNTVHPNMTLEQAKQKWKIPASARVIGLLPGSRKGEIKRLLPVMLASAQQLKIHYPEVVFLLPVASSLSEQDLAPYLETTTLHVQLVHGHFYDAMQLCDAAMVASGTATLEMALLGIPIALVYKTSFLTYWIAKHLIKIPFIGLCNIVAGKLIVKEFIQERANPEQITAEMVRIFEDQTYRQTMSHHFQLMKQNLGKGGGDTQAAKALLRLLTGAV